MRNSFSIRIINPTLMAISSSPLENIFSSLKINARFYQLIEKQTRFEYELVFIGYISAILLCRLAFLNLILTLSKKEKTATCRQYIVRNRTYGTLSYNVCETNVFLHENLAISYNQTKASFASHERIYDILHAKHALVSHPLYQYDCLSYFQAFIIVEMMTYHLLYNIQI